MHYDAIVVGLGGMGSATLWHLSRRGLRVLGLEQFDIAHDRGSSHGDTRIIRKAYFEHPDYVPLLHDAYAGWAEVEQASGQRLFERAGLLLAGSGVGAVLSGAWHTARVHGLHFETPTAAEARRRFPGFAIPHQADVLFEPDAGFLLVEPCVRACTALAQASGAEVRTGQRVTGWRADGGGVVVETADARYSAARLAICGGGWSDRLLADLRLPLTIRRKIVLWFDQHADHFRAERGCPVFGLDTSEGFFYGFPAINERGVKIGDHTNVEVVPSADAIERTVSPLDQERIRTFARQHLTGLMDQVGRSAVCMYTMTPDEHFIIDRHPAHAHVAFAAGFSGHGFKFAPTVGKVLADLLIDGATDVPVGFLSASRPALRNN